jgi:hypothetical protein
MSNRRQFNGSKIYSRDEITTFTDHELEAAMKDMSATIKQYRRDGRDARNFEIEFCYLDNEKQRRLNFGASSRRGGNFSRKDSRPRTHRHNNREGTPSSDDGEPVSPRQVIDTHI